MHSNENGGVSVAPKTEDFHSRDVDARLMAWHTRVRFDITLQKKRRLKVDRTDPAVRVVMLTGLRNERGWPLRCYSQIESARVPLQRGLDGRWHGTWLLPVGFRFESARDCYFRVLPEPASGLHVIDGSGVRHSA
jgi:hypothetical protein